MKIAVSGLGYVGLFNAVLLAQHNVVAVVGVVASSAGMLSARKSAAVDAELNEFLVTRRLNIFTMLDAEAVLAGVDYVIVVTSTKYGSDVNTFDAFLGKAVFCIAQQRTSESTIVIKSTVPVGFVDVRQRLGTFQLIFSPRLLHQGSGLCAKLHPSRIIEGEQSASARVFADLLLHSVQKTEVRIPFADPNKAEAIKLRKAGQRQRFVRRVRSGRTRARHQALALTISFKQLRKPFVSDITPADLLERLKAVSPPRRRRRRCRPPCTNEDV